MSAILSGNSQLADRIGLVQRNELHRAFCRVSSDIREATAYLRSGVQPNDIEVSRMCGALAEDAAWLRSLALEMRPASTEVTA